jgi:hypothetical protein
MEKPDVQIPRAVSVLRRRSPSRPAAAAEDAEMNAWLGRIKRCGVIVRGLAEVRDYLAQHPQMAPLAVRVCGLAKEMLAPGTELTLEVYHDPEIYDPHLVMYARQDVYDDDIMERIEEVRELYDDDFAAIPGRLHLTSDFQSPGGRRAV